jgi:hypothetical protein
VENQEEKPEPVGIVAQQARAPTQTIIGEISGAHGFPHETTERLRSSLRPIFHITQPVVTL